jgi:hypothetical protein
VANTEAFGYAAGGFTVQWKLFTNVGNVVAPIQMQEEAPLDIRQEVVDPSGLAAENAVRPPFRSDILNR